MAGAGGSPGAPQSCAGSAVGGGGGLNWEHEALLQLQREREPFVVEGVKPEKSLHKNQELLVCVVGLGSARFGGAS